MKTKIEDERGLTFVVGVRKKADNAWQAGCSCGFTTSGWATKGQAEDRLAQHAEEHETGEPAPELVDYRHEIGFDVDQAPPVIDPFVGDQSEDG